MSSAAEELGAAYRKKLTRAASKKHGVFYTPAALARRMAADLFPEGSAVFTRSPAPTILDPACGAGVFLVEIAKLINAACGQDAGRRKCLAEQCLYGVDLDRGALDIARQAIVDTLAADLDDAGRRCVETARLNLVEAHALFDASDFGPFDPADRKLSTELKVIDWQQRFPEVFARGGFDYAIGNPPYGLSRDEQIGPEENVKLLEVYRPFRSGKFNKYLAFLARGYQLLNRTGKLVYVVPNSWLGIKSGAALRRRLLADRALAGIDIYQGAVFEEASVEVVVVKIERGTPHAAFPIRRLRGLEEPNSCSSFVVPVGLCLSLPEAMIPLSVSKESVPFMQRLTAESGPLRICDLFVPRIALQAYLTGKGDPAQTPEQVKSHVYDRQAPEENAFPYLAGSDVRRYAIAWSGKYLLYGPWLAEPQRLEYFRGPRLLLREITGTRPYLITASFADEIYLYNRSILHILPGTKTSEEQLWALLAVLNSKLASFILLQQGRKIQRSLFPKLVNDDLKDFPLTNDFGRGVPLLAKAAREMSAAVSAGERGLQDRLQREIDGLVCELYRCSRSDVAVMEEMLR